MPPWEKDVEGAPGGGKEASAWGKFDCGDCCRDCWNPFRMLISDWAAGNEIMFGLSPRPDDGPFRESSRSPDLLRWARLALLELKGEVEVETGDIRGPVERPLDL